MAEPIRKDRVRITIGEATVEMSWAIAQELQARMLRFKATAPLVDQFGRIGTSRPAILRDDDVGPLLVVVSQWAKEVGLERLPTGISDLLGVLKADSQRPRLRGRVSRVIAEVFERGFSAAWRSSGSGRSL